MYESIKLNDCGMNPRTCCCLIILDRSDVNPTLNYFHNQLMMGDAHKIFRGQENNTHLRLVKIMTRDMMSFFIALVLNFNGFCHLVNQF